LRVTLAALKVNSTYQSRSSGSRVAFDGVPGGFIDAVEERSCADVALVDAFGKCDKLVFVRNVCSETANE
jgi:hypothetical protein